MHRRSTLLLATLGATLLMALALSTASARNFSMNEQRFSIRWPSVTYFYAAGDIECPVTLHGSFHRRTFVKTAGLLVGAINGATVNNGACTGGTVVTLTATLPWHVRYSAFAGTLPRITRVTLELVGVTFLLRLASGFECLFRTDTVEPFRTIFAVGGSGEIRSAELDPTAEVDLDNPNFLCEFAGDMNISGTGAVDGDVVEPVVLRLI